MPRVLVANALDGSVTFFDATTRKKLKTVKTGASPQGLAVARNGKFGYVANSAEHTITGLDVIRMSETTRLEPSGLEDPHGIAVLADGRSLFVTSGSKDTAHIIDGQTGQMRNTIDLGGRVTPSFAVTAAGDNVWLADPHGNRVLSVDPRTGQVVNEYTVDGSPGSVSLRRDGRNVVVALRETNEIACLDTGTGTITGRATVGGNPSIVAAHPYHESAFALSRGGGSVFHVDLGTMQTAPPIPVGLSPVALAIARAGKTLYVANSESDTLSVVDTVKRQVPHTWDTGHHPTAVLFIA